MVEILECPSIACSVLGSILVDIRIGILRVQDQRHRNDWYTVHGCDSHQGLELCRCGFNLREAANKDDRARTSCPRIRRSREAAFDCGPDVGGCRRERSLRLREGREQVDVGVGRLGVNIGEVGHGWIRPPISNLGRERIVCSPPPSLI